MARTHDQDAHEAYNIITQQLHCCMCAMVMVAHRVAATQHHHPAVLTSPGSNAVLDGPGSYVALAAAGVVSQ